MRNMNKTLCLLLVLCLALALAACGGKESAVKDNISDAVNAAQGQVSAQKPASEPTPEPTPEPTQEPTPEPTPEPTVVGKWETEIDVIDMMIQQLDAQVGGSASFGEYLDSLPWVLSLELTEDGNYTLGYDISRGLEPFKAAVVSYMRDMINEKAGRTVSDEQIAQGLGMPLEDYAAQVADYMTLNAESETATYRDEGGKLIWENGEESPYVLTSDTLTFSVNALGELVFHRVG